MKPANHPPEYYSFDRYNTKHRMFTYWYQISEVLALRPLSVLEIGVGSGLVTAYLRYHGIKVTTVDINPRLKPDCVGSVLELNSIFQSKEFEVTICARVLHHLPFSEFDKALEQIAYVTRNHALVVLPFDDIRLYFMTRYTSSQIKTISLPLPLKLKRILLLLSRYQSKTSGLWQVRSSKETAPVAIRATVSKYFKITNDYLIPEDSAHYVMVLNTEVTRS